MNPVRFLVIAIYLSLAAAPLLWLGITSLQSHEQSLSTTARVLPIGGDGHGFAPTLAAYGRLGEAYAGSTTTFLDYLLSSVVIGLLSTAASVALGTCCAYGFSRFRIPGAKDWLFFILSTRFMPPLAVVAPVLIMYRHFDLPNTHLGLIALYTVFNLSLAVCRAIRPRSPRHMRKRRWSTATRGCRPSGASSCRRRAPAWR